MSREIKINNPEGVYFLTFATVGWVDVFTRKFYRDMLLDSFRYCQKKKTLVIYAWCIMSNHVHLIASAGNGNLSGILRDMKSFTSKKIMDAICTEAESRREWMMKIFRYYGKYNPNNEEFQFWQQDNHPIELITNKFIGQKLNYIHYNPVEAGIVEEPEHYLYSSARDYTGIKGLLDIVLID